MFRNDLSCAIGSHLQLLPHAHGACASTRAPCALIWTGVSRAAYEASSGTCAPYPRPPQEPVTNIKRKWWERNRLRPYAARGDVARTRKCRPYACCWRAVHAHVHICARACENKRKCCLSQSQQTKMTLPSAALISY
eukprot:2628430-Pleurochrysis_carterae.AAC.3